MTTSTKQRVGAEASQVRLARVELVRVLDERVAKETPVVVRVGEFCVEVAGDFSTETLAAVLDVLEGLRR